MRLLSLVAILVMAVSTVAASPASAQTAPQSGTYRIGTCTVHLLKDIDVPARETGLLTEILVAENDAVQAKQVIARIDDMVSQRLKEQAQFKHTLATRQSEDERQIKMAERKKFLMEEEYNSNLEMYKHRSKTLFDLNRSLYQKQISVLEHAAAIEAQQLAGIQANAEMVNVKAAEDSIARHTIASPIDGYVLEVYKEAGEWVNAGEKVVRIAPLSKLRVTGNVDASKYDPHEVAGKPVTVTLTRARGKTVQFSGVVSHTSLERRGGALYWVIVEVENRLDVDGKHFMLQPESVVVMDIHIDGNAPNQLAKQPLK